MALPEKIFSSCMLWKSSFVITLQIFLNLCASVQNKVSKGSFYLILPRSCDIMRRKHYQFWNIFNFLDFLTSWVVLSFEKFSFSISLAQTKLKKFFFIIFFYFHKINKKEKRRKTLHWFWFTQRSMNQASGIKAN